MEIRLELTPEDAEELEQLMQQAKIKEYKELFSNALTLLYWATKEVKTGRVIASLDKANSKYKELAMPILEALKNKTSIEGSFGVIPGASHKTQ